MSAVSKRCFSHFLRKGLSLPKPKYLCTSAGRCGLYEPEDLPLPGPPSYGLLNIQMRGYDFTVVEHHMFYVTKLAFAVGAQVTKRWATPAACKKVQVLKPQSTLVEDEYDLEMYERNVQVGNVSASVLGLLLDTLNSTLPEGVTVTVKPHEDADEEYRYIPDYELNALRTQLTVLGGPVRKPTDRK